MLSTMESLEVEDYGLSVSRIIADLGYNVSKDSYESYIGRYLESCDWDAEEIAAFVSEFGASDYAALCDGIELRGESLRVQRIYGMLYRSDCDHSYLLRGARAINSVPRSDLEQYLRANGSSYWALDEIDDRIRRFLAAELIV